MKRDRTWRALGGRRRAEIASGANPSTKVELVSQGASGNTLHLDGADIDFDIDGDDVDEPAKWYLTLVRES